MRLVLDFVSAAGDLKSSHGDVLVVVFPTRVVDGAFIVHDLSHVGLRPSVESLVKTILIILHLKRVLILGLVNLLDLEIVLDLLKLFDIWEVEICEYLLKVLYTVVVVSQNGHLLVSNSFNDLLESFLVLRGKQVI